jgi:hypothetical protein
MAFKQTAVEWLAEQMLHPESFNPYIEQSKQMEKEQMIQFAMELHKRDLSKTGTDILLDEAHQLYFETFVL